VNSPQPGDAIYPPLLLSALALNILLSSIFLLSSPVPLGGVSSAMRLDLLVPRFPLRNLPAMLAISALGALLASLYGILHDQLTYTISPEYFTKLKFQQFAWADFGWPRRVFVAEIGMLASWWVGSIGGWLVARASAAELPPRARWPLVARSFAIVAVVTLTAGLIGWLYGAAVANSSSLSAWQIARQSLGVRDLPHFVIVAHIHNATYLCATLGILIAILYIRRVRRRESFAESDSPLGKSSPAKDSRLLRAGATLR